MTLVATPEPSNMPAKISLLLADLTHMIQLMLS
jgi:hypothetical protein